MSTQQRVKSPFATPDSYSTSLALCSAVKQFYKVKDAEIWYVKNRKMLHDMAMPDPFNFAKFETIHDWFNYQAIKRAYA